MLYMEQELFNDATLPIPLSIATLSIVDENQENLAYKPLSYIEMIAYNTITLTRLLIDI